MGQLYAFLTVTTFALGLAGEMDTTRQGKPDMRQLSGSEAEELLSGRTLTFENTPNGLVVNRYREVYTVGGRLTVELDRVRNSGIWRVQDDSVCIEVVSSSSEECRNYFVNQGGDYYVDIITKNSPVSRRIKVTIE